MQSDVAVSGNNKVTGTLKYVTDYTGFSGETELQSGNYLAMKWSEPAEGVTSLKVGLVPSAIGMDLVECIDDTDRNGVFRVTSNDQKLKIVQSDGEHTKTQTFDLSELTLTDSGV